MKKNRSEPSNIINYVDMFAVSPTEQTGLLSIPPANNFEMESYMEIMPFRADCDFIKEITEKSDLE